jgi:hypothetical protein
MAGVPPGALRHGSPTRLRGAASFSMNAMPFVVENDSHNRILGVNGRMPKSSGQFSGKDLRRWRIST